MPSGLGTAPSDPLAAQFFSLWEVAVLDMWHCGGL